MWAPAWKNAATCWVQLDIHIGQHLYTRQTVGWAQTGDILRIFCANAAKATRTADQRHCRGDNLACKSSRRTPPAPLEIVDSDGCALSKARDRISTPSKFQLGFNPTFHGNLLEKVR